MADPTLPRFNPNENSAVVPFFFMHEGEECVKIQIAGETRFTPVYRANDMWERDGLQEITYAERWPEQYAQFKNGAAQVADGTALDNAPFLNPSRIADLRNLKIYSIEALASIDDRNIQRLGGKGYELKAMAAKWLAERMQRGSDNKIAEMAAQIEALKAMVDSKPRVSLEELQILSQEEPTTEEYAAIKEQIKVKTGSYPRGNPSLSTLKRLLSELDGE